MFIILFFIVIIFFFKTTKTFFISYNKAKYIPVIYFYFYIPTYINQTSD